MFRSFVFARPTRKYKYNDWFYVTKREIRFMGPYSSVPVKDLGVNDAIEESMFNIFQRFLNTHRFTKGIRND